MVVMGHIEKNAVSKTKVTVATPTAAPVKAEQPKEDTKRERKSKKD